MEFLVEVTAYKHVENTRSAFNGTYNMFWIVCDRGVFVSIFFVVVVSCWLVLIVFNTTEKTTRTKRKQQQ